MAMLNNQRVLLINHDFQWGRSEVVTKFTLIYVNIRDGLWHWVFDSIPIKFPWSRFIIVNDGSFPLNPYINIGVYPIDNR